MPQKLIYPSIKELSKIEKTLTDFLEKMEADFENVKEQLQNAKKVFFEKFYFDKEKWAVLPFCDIYTNFDGSWRSLKMNADEVEVTCDDSSCELKIDENNLRFTYTAPSNAKNGDVNVCRIWTNDNSSVTAIVPVLII